MCFHVCKSHSLLKDPQNQMLHEKKWILSQGVSKPIGWCLDVLLSCTSTVWVELRHHIVPRMFKTRWMMFGCLIVLYFHGLSWVETPHCPKDIQNPLDDVWMSYCLVLPRFELSWDTTLSQGCSKCVGWCLDVLLSCTSTVWVELRHHIYILDQRRSLAFNSRQIFLQLNGTDIRGALLPSSGSGCNHGVHHCVYYRPGRAGQVGRARSFHIWNVLLNLLG